MPPSVLTAAALQRIAAMLSAPQGQPAAAPGGISAWAQNGLHTNRVMTPTPAPTPTPAIGRPTWGPNDEHFAGESANRNPPVPPTNAIAGSESAVNQNPPVPNPPLPPPAPPVTNASFSPPGTAPPATPGPQPASGFPTLQPSPLGAPPVAGNMPVPVGAPPAPNVANLPAPVGTDPSMADPGIRQTIINAMKAKNMLPPQWAQNFGSLADQQGR